MLNVITLVVFWFNHGMHALVYNSWGLIFVESSPNGNMSGVLSVTVCWITKPWASSLDFESMVIDSVKM